jgi:hypothetical protein
MSGSVFWCEYCKENVYSGHICPNVNGKVVSHCWNCGIIIPNDRRPPVCNEFDCMYNWVHREDR